MSFEAVVAALLRSSPQGALFIAAVWLACRLFPRLPAAVRCGLWWAACLKLLVGLVWIAPVEVPVLPAVPDSTSVFQRTVSGAAGALTSPALLSQPPSRPPGEEGDQQKRLASSSPLSPGGREGGWERGGRGSEGSRRRRGVESGRAPDVTLILLFLWLAGLAVQSAKALRQLRTT